MTCGKKPNQMTDEEREQHGLPARKPVRGKPSPAPVREPVPVGAKTLIGVDMALQGGDRVAIVTVHHGAIHVSDLRSPFQC